MRNEKGGSGEEGFTLLEVLIAAAIFTIVTGAVYALLAVGQADAFHTQQKVEAVQNARVALNTIGRDAINAGAGYWKFGASVPDDTLERLLFLPPDDDDALDVLTPVVPGDDVRTIAAGGEEVATDVVTFVYQDNEFNGGQSIPVSAVNETSGVVTLGTENTPCRGAEKFVYILDDGTSQVLGSLTAAPSTGANKNKIYFEEDKDPLKLNRQGSGSGLAELKDAASCRLITWVTYFVNDEGTLVRREYGQTEALVGDGVVDDGEGGVVVVDEEGDEFGFVEMPLAFGVEQFQVRYLLDDGSIVDDVLATTDEDGNVVEADKNRVRIRQVILTLTIRSPEVDRAAGRPTRVTVTGAFFTPNLVAEERPGGEV